MTIQKEIQGWKLGVGIFLSSILYLLCSANAAAQFSYRLTFTGTRSYTNSAGRIVNKPVSTRTLINDCALGSGITNSKKLSLVYHINADPRGDQIEVVDNASGAVICTPFLLYYPTLTNVFDGGGIVVSNSPATPGNSTLRVDRLLYFFGNQIGHSIGTANVSVNTSLDSSGNTNKVRIDGNVAYFRLPEGPYQISVVKGKFTAKKPFFPSGSGP